MRTIAAVVFSVLLIAAGVGIASASPVDQVTEDCEGISGTASCTLNYIWGQATGFLSDIGAEEPDSRAVADSLESEFNENSAEWVEWANAHAQISDPADYDVVRINIEGDTQETVYILADHDGSNFTSAEVAENNSETIDWVITLEGRAARDAPDLMESFYKSHVKTDEAVNGSTAAAIAGKYGGYVTITNA